MATLTARTLVADTTTPSSYPIASGTAFTDATTLDVAYPKHGKLVLVINSTYAGANSVVIGTGGDYIASGQGTLTVVTAQNGVYYEPITSSRFKVGAAGAGTVNITFGTSNTGFIEALLIP
jgi:hypothetical protein